MADQKNKIMNFLFKEEILQVKNHKMKISKGLLINFGIFLVSFLFFIIGWSTNEWLKVKIDYRWGVEKIKYGLWEYCTSESCYLHYPQHSSGVLRAVQSLSMFIFIAYIFGTFFFTYFLKSSLEEENEEKPFHLQMLILFNVISCKFFFTKMNYKRLYYPF